MRWISFAMIATFLIAAPVGLWLLGANAPLMTIVNLISLALTIRLLSVVARVARHAGPVLGIGFLGGFLGEAIIQLILHTARGEESLSTWFASYAALGASLYRWEVTHVTAALIIMAISGLFYAGLGSLIFRVRRWRPVRRRVWTQGV
ncbi:hypothetical protein Sulac_3500 [Sulfobacillus acidophilus DSM 10332]|uniref:Uncharacterized protein n=1 Tax=Sulfobacillus acidophilus (strain ATCC 700253 / DSM 10332 / NAL) TaxID=679936 RepID=G8TUX2_SULAD|nr:hypothetical protein Sulac_3500 [Sulfobacillus acidophilus DSM 10332]